jgi:hypothetical protein
MTRKMLLFLSLLAFAAPQIMVTQTAQNAGFGTIKGTVVREGTNDPIPEVQITLTARGGMTAQEAQAILNLVGRGGAIANNIPAETLQSAQEAARGGQTLTAVTDSLGQFTIESVPVGNPTVRVQLEGYFGTPINGNYLPTVTLPVTVTKDQTSTLKVSMVAGGTISGRVLDTTGKPFSESPVQILRTGYEEGRQVLQPQDFKQSDDRGEFRFYRLPPGEYYIAAGPKLTAALLGVQPNAAGNSHEITATTFYPNVTDPSTATPINVRGGEELSGISIQMRTVLGARVSGQVTSTVPPGPTAGPGGQVRTGGVQLVATNSIGLINLDGALAQTLGADGGTFEFKNVPPGTYDVIARISTARGGGWGPQAPPATATGPWAVGRTSIDVQNADIDNLAVVVRTGVDIKGRILLDGNPIRANARITLQPALQNVNDGQMNSMFNQIRQYAAPIADDGGFLFPLIPEGRYRVQVALNPAAPARGVVATGTPAPALAANTYLADIRQGGGSVYDNGLVVTNEPPNPIEVLLNTNAGSLEGNVVGPDQKPAGANTVVLVPPDNRRQNTALYRNIRSDAQGHFLLQNLPPGPYTLYAWESVPQGAYQNAQFMSKYAGRGTAVNVQTGTRTTATVNLIR